MKRLLAIGLAALFVSATWAADESKSILFEDTGPFKHVDETSAHRLSRQMLLHERNRIRLASAPNAVSQDVGDIAVIADNGAILIQPRPASPFDLPLPTNLTFTPTATGFNVAFAAASLDPGIGGALPLGDDDTENVPLGFAFPFLGASYASIFVNSDGNITFGAGDSASTARDAARLIGGPPRVAPLLNDLNPEAGGTINASVRVDRVVVTWTNVPEFGTTNANTFQVTLFASGQITYTYASLDADFGVIGVAEGDNEGPINEIDLTADLPAGFAAGAIFEEFTPGHRRDAGGRRWPWPKSSTAPTATNTISWSPSPIWSSTSAGRSPSSSTSRTTPRGSACLIVGLHVVLRQRRRAGVVPDDEPHRAVLAGRQQDGRPADSEVPVLSAARRHPGWASGGRPDLAARAAVRDLKRRFRRAWLL